MATALVLVVLGVLNRVVPHPPNAVALGAIALFAGARLPRRWAFAVPLAALVLSDLYLDRFVYPGFAGPFVDVTRLTVYATYALIAALSGLWRGPVGVGPRAGMSLGASTLFFVTSNLAVWAASSGYPKSLAGLVLCYTMALPFFAYQAAADLAGTGLLFGLDALAHRRALPRPEQA